MVVRLSWTSLNQLICIHCSHFSNPAPASLLLSVLSDEINVTTNIRCRSPSINLTKTGFFFFTSCRILAAQTHNVIYLKHSQLWCSSYFMIRTTVSLIRGLCCLKKVNGLRCFIYNGIMSWNLLVRSRGGCFDIYETWWKINVIDQPFCQNNETNLLIISSLRGNRMESTTWLIRLLHLLWAAYLQLSLMLDLFSL